MNEPSGLSRRGLLAGAGALLAGAGLAGCENTTTPVATEEGASGKGIMGDPTAGGPVDGSGIPLARRDYPVTLPKVGDPVKAGKPESGGELQVYNYADYLNPEVIKAFGKQENVSVRVTTFNSLDEAFTKLSTGRLKFDVIFTAPDHLSRLVGRRLVQPLNLDLVPNLKTEVWPELQNPFYDVGPRYTVPYTLYTTGIGWRNDEIKAFDPAELGWESFWKSQPYRGRVGILDDSREGDRDGADVPRRDRPQHRGPGAAQARVGGPQGAQRDRAREGDDHRLRDAAGRAHVAQPGLVGRHAQRGHLLPARGDDRRGALVLDPAPGGPVFNDCMCVGAEAEKPVLAHRFLNYMLDPKNALENFVGYVGYQPPITKIDAQALFDQQLLPQNLANCVVTREDYANGNAYLALTAGGRRAWDQNWDAFRNG